MCAKIGCSISCPARLTVRSATSPPAH